MELAKIIRIFYLLLLIIYGFYQMIISIITYQKFIEIADNYNYLVENFK